MLIIAAILFPMIAGTAVSVCGFSSEKKRNIWYILVLAGTDLLFGLCMAYGKEITLFRLTDKAEMAFMLDSFGRIVLLAVMVLYTAVCFYAFEYMKMEERPNVFFGFYFVSMGALAAVCMSANLITLYFCFELATLSSV
ncbi:MAG: hypothetical protein IIY55_09245, partial [Blautia sp.]|nr:hypothetical protein [Blautia sp.]